MCRAAQAAEVMAYSHYGSSKYGVMGFAPSSAASFDNYKMLQNTAMTHLSSSQAGLPVPRYLLSTACTLPNVIMSMQGACYVAALASVHFVTQPCMGTIC